MNRRLEALVAAVCVVALAVSNYAFKEKSPDGKRAEILAVRGETANLLFGVRPGAHDLIKNSEGYGVFSTKGMKILVAGGTSGKGVLVDLKTGKTIFMKMAQVNVGLGCGLQDARIVWNL